MQGRGWRGVAEVFGVFLRLGLTSFGGPVAHLGYFREEFVRRRGWLDERAYADLVALCQFLPGPASSQVGMAVGLYRAGLGGALAAWLGFTLPSAALLVLFALGVARLEALGSAGWLHGLKVVAVAVVAQAVWGMAQTLTPDRPRLTLAVAAAMLALLLPGSLVQVAIIAASGAAGVWLLRGPVSEGPASLPLQLGRRWGLLFLALFFALLLALPLLCQTPALALFDSFYRAGALVFGGGHVVLPLLQAEVVPPGWVDPQAFVAGYGAAQAVPGPLFTFAAYLGAVNRAGLAPLVGAAIALVGIFLPAFLLVAGTLPFWNRLRGHPGVQAALRGINAGVVGILLAALYTPVWTSAIGSGADFALALGCFTLLAHWKAPPWLVVLLAAGVGGVLG
ncbi:chromate efflux transporter [Meiothermus sp. Pnk-1]|uniref:chromate efflux transporter n=1 Tax=Meiothermus sp. Pnk-1 TaxID=873128 RepID=UPI0013141515